MKRTSQINQVIEDFLNDELTRLVDEAESKGFGQASRDDVLRLAHEVAKANDVEVRGLDGEGNIVWYWEA